MARPSGCAVFALVVCSFFGGCVAGGSVGAARTPLDQGRVIYARLPHHVPPSPEAVGFRFAMVHDVIHERYPRHGPAYYRELERVARERLPVLHPDSESAFALTDDLAVALHRLGQTGEAVALMRDKLKRQQALDLPPKDLYSSHANLGEFLTQPNLRAMLGGDAAARALVTEGLEQLRTSVRVNPSAHFGRENWQIVAVDVLLDAGKHPELLTQVDLIGNRIDAAINVPADQEVRGLKIGVHWSSGRPFTPDWVEILRPGNSREVRDFTRLTPDQREDHRRYIEPVGGEPFPGKSDGDKRGRRAPFDEPAVWLVGEWRQGSGPNPHLALCLGEIMLRVGQRYLAWTCYERAGRLADGYSAREDHQRFLREHCRARQAAIEKSLPAGEVEKLRPRFEAELAHGEAYQRDYQAFEENKIRAGADVTDAHFYDEFHAGRPPIASRVGPEEWYAGVAGTAYSLGKIGAFWEWGLLSGGACVLLLALFLSWYGRPRRPHRRVTRQP